MTLTDIKEKITGQLSKLTIDDFYSDPQISFAKKTFMELTKLKSEDEFEKFLSDKFPETTAETLRFYLEQAITKFTEQIASVEKLIQTSQTEIDKLDKQVAKKKEQQAAIPKQQDKTKSELTEIETEIKQIKPLAGKPPYDKQMEALEKAKEKKQKELDNYPTAISKLKSEVDELQTKIKSEKEIIATKQSEIKTIQTSIGSKQKELEQLTEKETTHFKNEYSSLEFLFLALLHKGIRKEPVFKTVKTGKTIYNYRGAKCAEEIQEKTGELILASHKIGFDEVCKFISSLTISANSIPKDWRKIIYQTLSNPIADIAGSISKIRRDNTEYFKQKPLELTHIDTSTLLATKIAAKTNYSIRTANNKIVLALSGGLSATISFREKGDLIAKFQKQPFEIYANCFSREQYVLQTLYYQTGYANSEIQVKTPGGYYILTDKFVIEIEFDAAPILFDNNSVIKFAPNISGKAKHEDEVKAAEEAEEEAEEERRRRDDDDYYDDYY